MAAVESNMLPLGTKAPDFNLSDVVTGESVSIETFKDKKALLIMFVCRHCPFVKHAQNQIAEIAQDYTDKSLGIAAISANDITEYPEDAPEGLKEQAEEIGFTFPYLYDESQQVAKSYTAACTPDFFLFDQEKKLVYRGQMDDSRPGNSIPVTGKDLRTAIDQVLSGNPVPLDQKPSMGCSIKWKENN